MKGIADTGFLVAFANRADNFHDWAVGIGTQISQPLLTCEAVLAETAFHLQNSSLVFEMIDEGLIALAFDVNDHLSRLHELAERYSDRNPDLADLCIIRMSELFPKHSVITTDVTDFSIYRRNKREAIPLICPSDRRQS
jgi:predicted nucleic acid-binding protein